MQAHHGATAVLELRSAEPHHGLIRHGARDADRIPDLTAGLLTSALPAHSASGRQLPLWNASASGPCVSCWASGSGSQRVDEGHARRHRARGSLGRHNGAIVGRGGTGKGNGSGDHLRGHSTQGGPSGRRLKASLRHGTGGGPSARRPSRLLALHLALVCWRSDQFARRWFCFHPPARAFLFRGRPPQFVTSSAARGRGKT